MPQMHVTPNSVFVVVPTSASGELGKPTLVEMLTGGMLCPQDLLRDTAI